MSSKISFRYCLLQLSFGLGINLNDLFVFEYSSVADVFSIINLIFELV